MQFAKLRTTVKEYFHGQVFFVYLCSATGWVEHASTTAGAIRRGKPTARRHHKKANHPGLGRILTALFVGQKLR
jgi:hypothetical protein